MAIALIGLGANLGDRPRTLFGAVERLATLPSTRLVARSTWRTTSPVGGPAGQDAFLNGAALLETSLAPVALHDQLHRIEEGFGRRRGQRWEARVLDLDLLTYGEQVIRTANLLVPHPGLAYRRFVLEPAAEIAADLLHPTIGWSIGQLLAHLNTAANYLAIEGANSQNRNRFASELAGAIGAQLLTAGDLDPPVQSLAQGIEFLATMQRILAPVKTSRGSQFWVSDFCGSAFPSRLRSLDAREQAELIAAWQATLPRVSTPKLLVALGEWPFEDGRATAYRGPCLQINTQAGNQDALAEVTAAVEAMR